LLGLVDVDPAVPVSVGSQPLGAGGEFFSGHIDDVRILQRAMSASEIRDLAISQQQSPPPSAAVLSSELSLVEGAERTSVRSGNGDTSGIVLHENPSPPLRVKRTELGFDIIVESEPDQLYQLESSTDLIDWIERGEAIGGDGEVLIFRADPALEKTRQLFFRVRKFGAPSDRHDGK